LNPGSGSDSHRLLERAEEAAQAGSWEWDVETDELLWSDNLYRLFGLEPGEITPTVDYVVERTHVDDRERVVRVLEHARLDRQIAPLEYRILRTDDALRHLRVLALQPVIERAEGRVARLVGSVQDVTDWQRAERQIAAHVAVSESLGHWVTFEHGAAELLRNLARALDCAAGVLWVPRDDTLHPRVFWHSRTIDASEFDVEIGGRRVGSGVGLPGKVWDTKEPRARSRTSDGRTTSNTVDGLVAIPALHGEDVLAVLEFFSPALRTSLSERLIRSLAGIGYELGEFLSHRRGELTPHTLTSRELQVLRLASHGRTAREIGDELFVSPSTVATHFKHVYEKYGVSDRAAAVAKALREGLIE
jgi:DNA-binding CsgD family transcriptional regulator